MTVQEQPAMVLYRAGIVAFHDVHEQLAYLQLEAQRPREPRADGSWIERVHLRSDQIEPIVAAGAVSFGAYLAMFVFVLAWQRLRAPAVDAGWLIDRTMIACLVCSAFGRLGCLSYGCCYGRVWQPGVCHHSVEAKVRRELGPAGALPRIPTQFFSALLAFGCSLAMLSLLAWGARPGFASELGALLYGLGRFHLESLRDERRFLSDRLTRGQVLSAAIAGLALALLALPGAGPLGNGLTLAWDSLRELGVWPLLVALPVFAICGYHRERVGSW